MNGASTLDNLIDVMDVMNQAKEVQQRYRTAKVAVAQRQKSFVLFVDFRKAFDRMNRRILIDKMLRMGINP